MLVLEVSSVGNCIYTVNPQSWQDPADM